MLRRRHLATLATLGLLALACAAPARAQRPEDIALGFAAPLSGPEAHYGKDMQNGIKLAIDEMNATGPTINGHAARFMLQSEDDQADPRRSMAVAQTLVDANIKGMLGHFNSGTTIPASRIYAQAGIPEIAMATAPEYTRQGFKTTFRMMTSDLQQGAVLGTFAVKKLRLRRIAVIDDGTVYGKALADSFEKAARAAGARIVDRQHAGDLPTGTKQTAKQRAQQAERQAEKQAVGFRAILAHLKRVEPSAIFYAGPDAKAAELVRQMRELDLKATLLAGEMVKTDDFLKAAGPAADGTIASLAGLPLAQMPGGPGFAKRYQKRFGEPPGIYAPYAYDGAMAMMVAMKRADSSAPAKYLPFLQKTRMPAVTTRNLEYDANGDLKNSSITVYKVVGGQWTVLQTVGK